MDQIPTIIGAASGLRAVMERIALVSKSEVPVLIFGETGSGKEVVARNPQRFAANGAAIRAGELRRDPA